MQNRSFPEYEAKVGKLISEDEKVSSNENYSPKCEVSESTVKPQVLIWTEGTHREEITNFTDPSHIAKSKCARVQTRSSNKNKEAVKETETTQEKVTTLQNKSTRPQSKVTNIASWFNKYSMAKLRQKQYEDSYISCVMKRVEVKERPCNQEVCSWSPAARHYWNSWEQLQIIDGVLFRKFDKRDDTAHYLQMIVPSSMKKEILTDMHACLLSGHLGKKKTHEKLLRRYYWYDSREDTNIFVTLCDICGANKTPDRTPKAPLGNMKVGAPMDRLATDIFGPLPLTARGN